LKILSQSPWEFVRCNDAAPDEYLPMWSFKISPKPLPEKDVESEYVLTGFFTTGEPAGNDVIHYMPLEESGWSKQSQEFFKLYYDHKNLLSSHRVFYFFHLNGSLVEKVSFYLKISDFDGISVS
jgi:hypothetical protein